MMKIALRMIFSISFILLDFLMLKYVIQYYVENDILLAVLSTIIMIGTLFLVGMMLCAK